MPCCRHNEFDCSGFWGDLCDSTAFSTRRFLTRSVGNFLCFDLHSGQNHSVLSWSAMWLEIHAWQKLCPQPSVILIGAVNKSFVCSNLSYKKWSSQLVNKQISARILSILSKLNLRHSFLLWNNKSVSSITKSRLTNLTSKQQFEFRPWLQL